MHFDKEFDASGLACPMPIVKTKKALAGMAAGQVLRVVATDPGSVAMAKKMAIIATKGDAGHGLPAPDPRVHRGSPGACAAERCCHAGLDGA